MKLFEVDGVYFDNKAQAKAHRAAHGGRVSKGPDHWLYGIKGNQKTHAHNAHSGGHGNGFPKRKPR